MKKAKKTAGHLINIFQGGILAFFGLTAFTIDRKIDFDSLTKIHINSSLETREKIYKSRSGTRKQLTFMLPNVRQISYTDRSAKIDKIKQYLSINIPKTFWIDPKINIDGNHELWQVEINNRFQTILLISYEDRINNETVLRKLLIGMGICGSIITICSVYEIILIVKKQN